MSDEIKLCNEIIEAGENIDIAQPFAILGGVKRDLAFEAYVRLAVERAPTIAAALKRAVGALNWPYKFKNDEERKAQDEDISRVEKEAEEFIAECRSDGETVEAALSKHLMACYMNWQFASDAHDKLFKAHRDALSDISTICAAVQRGK